jgi:hypothetical protein
MEPYGGVTTVDCRKYIIHRLTDYGSPLLIWPIFTTKLHLKGEC